ncbi:MAG TPA: glycosyltransferase family 39 protein [Solirubrobacteraceae bacterium]
MRRWGWALAGIVVLAAALRLWQLGDRSLWVDEAFTLRHVDGDLGHVLDRMSEEDSAPLYPLLAWGWSKVFGLSEAGLRSLPALLGVLTVPVVWAAAARVGGRPAAAAAALLTAVSPFLVWHAQDARPYALLILLGAVAFLAFLRVLEDGSRRWAAVWAVGSVLAVLTHYDAVFPFGVEAVWLVLGTRGTARRAVLVAAGVPVLLGLALIPLAVAQSGGGLTGGGVGGEAGFGGGDNSAGGDVSFLGISDVEFLARRVAYVGGQFATGYQPRAQRFTALAAAVLLVLAIAAVLRLVPRERLRRVAVPAGVGLTTILAAVLLTVAGIDQVYTRFQSPAFVPLVVALGAGLALCGRRVGVALVAALAALGIGVTLATAGDAKFGTQDWRTAFAALGQSDEWRLVVLSAPYGKEMLPVYRPYAVLPREPFEVTEVVALALPDNRLRGGRQPEPPRPFVAPLPPAGFELVAYERAETYTLLRYRARKRTTPFALELEALRLFRGGQQPPLIALPPGG